MPVVSYYSQATYDIIAFHNSIPLAGGQGYRIILFQERFEEPPEQSFQAGLIKSISGGDKAVINIPKPVKSRPFSPKPWSGIKNYKQSKIIYPKLIHLKKIYKQH